MKRTVVVGHSGLGRCRTFCEVGVLTTLSPYIPLLWFIQQCDHRWCHISPIQLVCTGYILYLKNNFICMWQLILITLFDIGELIKSLRQDIIACN